MIPKKVHNKAVRVCVPALLEINDVSFRIEEVSGPRRLEYMTRKLLEESRELAEAIRTHGLDSEKRPILDEMADVEEVLSTLRTLLGVTKNQVKKRQTVKKFERGGFLKRGKVLVLRWTKEVSRPTE